MAVDFFFEVYYGTSGLTETLNDVQSVSVSVGRQWTIDPFYPSQLVITCRNPSGWSVAPKVRDYVFVNGDYNWFSGRITDVSIEYGIKTVEDVVTITAEGPLAQVAKRNVSGLALAEGTTDTQFTTLMTTLGITLYSSKTGASIASAQTYTGNALEFLNQLVATECGRLKQSADVITFMPRYDIDETTPIAFSDVPADWTTYLKFDAIKFRSAGENFYTQVRITPLGLAIQVESSGAAPYIALAQDSYDYTTTQGDSHARYLLNQYKTKTAIITEISFSYQQQKNATTKDDAMTYATEEFAIGQAIEIKFRGTTYYAVTEGVSVFITPEDVNVTYYLSAQDLNSYLRWGGSKTYNKWDSNKWGF